jgi:TrmH family RNA methyltransferase
LLTQPQRDRIDVVLVSPRNPLNIGAAARAMANFGFRRLAVVAPFEAHWREAKSAVGAPQLLTNAQETATLAEAVSDCTLVIGTGTLARRKPEQRVVPLPELAPIVRDQLARGGRLALLFGSEKRGLTSEDLAHCHLLVEIPTDSRQPSMNLGQAVAVCLYEIASRISEPGAGAKDISRSSQTLCPDNPRAQLASPRGDPPATSGDLELLAGVVEATMLAANYSPAAMRKANRRDLHLLLRRMALTRRDCRRALGLFRRILWRLQHRCGPAED